MSKRSHYVKAVKKALGVWKVLCRGRDDVFSVTVRDAPGLGITVYWFNDGDPVEEVVESVKEEWKDHVWEYCGYPKRSSGM
jgi:hypothetical protein